MDQRAQGINFVLFLILTLQAMCFCYNNSFLCTAAKEREKALKQSQMQKSMSVSRGNTPAGTPTKGAKKNTASITSGVSTPARKYTVDQQQMDISGLNLNDTLTGKKPVTEEPPKVDMAREKVLEEAKRALEADEGRKGISIVVIGEISFFSSKFDLTQIILPQAMLMPGSPRLWADYCLSLVGWTRRQGELTRGGVKR